MTCAFHRLAFTLAASALVFLASEPPVAGARDAADGGAAAACEVRVHGAVTATFACVAAITWDESRGFAAASLLVPRPAPLGLVNVTIARPGPPALGTWRSGDRGADGAVVVARHGAPLPTWLASSASQGIPAQGSYTLVVTSLAVSADAPYGKGFVGHGTLEATLAAQPKTSARGEVQLRAQF